MTISSFYIGSTLASYFFVAPIFLTPSPKSQCLFDGIFFSLIFARKLLHVSTPQLKTAVAATLIAFSVLSPATAWTQRTGSMPPDGIRVITQSPVVCEPEERQINIIHNLYSRGNERVIQAVEQFVDQYPDSWLVPEAWATAGDRYFFTGRYGDALRAYSHVPDDALDTERDLDITYRKGYSLLRVGRWSDAESLFARLQNSTNYRTAGTFYNAYTEYAQGNYSAALDDFKAVKGNNELTQAAQYYICQINFVQGNYSQAISSGRQLLEQSSGNPATAEFGGEMHRIVGEGEYQQGNDNQAATHIQAYIDAYESDPELTSLYILGVIDFRRSEWDAAIKHLSPVTEADDAMAQSAWLYIGQAYLKTENLNMAAMAFERAMRMPFDQDAQETAFYNYALTQNDGGRTPFNRSIDYFEEFLNLYPNSRYAAAVEDYLIDAYLNGNDYNRALQSIERIKKPSTKVLQAKQRVLYGLGTQALANDRPAEAQKHLSQAYELGDFGDKMRWECSLWLAESQFRQGNYRDAETSAARYLRNARKTDTNYGVANYLAGYARFEQRKYDSARDPLATAATCANLDERTRADAYNRLGDSYYYSKQYASAREAYAKAYSICPGSAGDYALYQQALASGLGKDHSGKIQLLDRMIEQYPASTLIPAAMLAKAEAQIAVGNNSGAINTYTDLNLQYPGSAQARAALLQKAITQRNAGSEDDAIESYKQVITLYPKSDEAQVAGEDLKLIYSDRGQLTQYTAFMSSVPDAPQVDPTEIENLTIAGADRARNAGRHTDALEQYNSVTPSTPENFIKTHLGAMRSAMETKQYDQVISHSEALLSGVNLTLAEENETSFNHAYALLQTGKSSQAEKEFNILAQNPSSLYGARAAYELANLYFTSGNSSKAEATINDLIEAGTPHQYWLARAFILLADIMHQRGDNFEAREYLQSLRNNYPGNETDIQQMIDSRLRKWKAN